MWPVQLQALVWSILALATEKEDAAPRGHPHTVEWKLEAPRDAPRAPDVLAL